MPAPLRAVSKSFIQNNHCPWKLHSQGEHFFLPSAQIPRRRQLVQPVRGLNLHPRKCVDMGQIDPNRPPTLQFIAGGIVVWE